MNQVTKKNAPPPPKLKQEEVNVNKNFFKTMTTAQKVLVICLLPLLGFSMLPILIVLLIGLMPTITVLITDYKNSDKLMVIGCFNMAGVFIYIFNVINKFDVHNALSIASDVFNLIVMLGSAAVGMALYSELPKFFISYSKISSEKRLKQIDEKLSKIEEEWGGGALRTKEVKGKSINPQTMEEQDNQSENQSKTPPKAAPAPKPGAPSKH